MKIQDQNLLDALKACSEREREAIGAIIAASGCPDSDSQRILRKHAMRKIKAMLKRKARRRRDANL
jgi:hypothetical protein